MGTVRLALPILIEIGWRYFNLCPKNWLIESYGDTTSVDVADATVEVRCWSVERGRATMVSTESARTGCWMERWIMESGSGEWLFQSIPADSTSWLIRGEHKLGARVSRLETRTATQDSSHELWSLIISKVDLDYTNSTAFGRGAIEKKDRYSSPSATGWSR